MTSFLVVFLYPGQPAQLGAGSDFNQHLNLICWNSFDVAYCQLFPGALKLCSCNPGLFGI
jgi:hypothetical protein